MSKIEKALDIAIHKCIKLLKEEAKKYGDGNEKKENNFYLVGLANLAGNGLFNVVSDENGIEGYVIASMDFMKNLAKWFSCTLEELNERIGEDEDDDDEDDEDEDHKCEHCK